MVPILRRKWCLGLACVLGVCLVPVLYQSLLSTTLKSVDKKGQGKAVISRNHQDTQSASKPTDAQMVSIDCTNWDSYKKSLLSRSEGIPVSAKDHYLRCLAAFAKHVCRSTKTFAHPLAGRVCHRQEEMRFLNDDEVRGVYLLHSFPGSGNTWVRHIIEELTGVFSGSVYCDRLLTVSGMWGEGMDTEYVSVVKNHMPSYKSKGDAVIGIVRNPYHAVTSYIAFLSTHAHTVAVSMDSVSDSSFSRALKKWKASVSLWRKIQEQGEPLHIVQFDNLVNDFEPEVRRLAGFLNLPVTEEDIQCVVKNRMDTYKRSKSRGPFPYSEEQAAQIGAAIMSYEHIWDAHNISYWQWEW